MRAALEFVERSKAIARCRRRRGLPRSAIPTSRYPRRAKAPGYCAGRPGEAAPQYAALLPDLSSTALDRIYFGEGVETSWFAAQASETPDQIKALIDRISPWLQCAFPGALQDAVVKLGLNADTEIALIVPAGLAALPVASVRVGKENLFSVTCFRPILRRAVRRARQEEVRERRKG